VIISISNTAAEGEIRHVIERIRECGFREHVSRGAEKTVIGVIGSGANRNQIEALRAAPGVESITPITEPFKLVSKEIRADRTKVQIKGVCFGGPESVVIAGPCSVESRDQLLQTARAVREAGATMLRGGAYKPRTSPYDFQGLGLDALKLLQEASHETGLPFVTEIMSTEDVEIVSEYADMLQVGARNMQNFALLRRLASSARPILPSADHRRRSKSGSWLLSTCSQAGTRTWSCANGALKRSRQRRATRWIFPP